MSGLVAFAVRRPGFTLLASVALTLAFATGALRLEPRTAGEAFEPREDAVIDQSARDRIRFRDPRSVLLVVRARAAAPIASPEGFRFLRLLRLSGRGAAVTAGALLLLSAAPAEAREPACDGSAEPAARELMARIERRARRVPHILRMQIATHYHQGGQLAKALGEDPEPKTLWGVVSGDPDASRQLFVFTGPGRMAGTSLLLHDFADGNEPDTMWFYLRAFRNFEKLAAGAERVVVAGTALTYEDARGFIDSGKYRFRFVPGESSAPARILACPRTPAIADALGYGSILMEADRERLLVQRIDYRGLGGAPLKRYRVLETVTLGERVFPARVELVHRVNGFRNDVRSEYWRPKVAPEPALFRPDPSRESFLSRLQRFLHQNGLGDRIDAEIDAADARVRAWEERWGRQAE